MLIRKISDRWSGLNLRNACQRWIAGGGAVKALAESIRISQHTLLDWLNDNDRAYIVPVNASSLEVLHKYNKTKNKKKRGPNPVRSERVQYIKEIGAHEYARRLLRDYRISLGLAPEAPSDA